MGKTRRRMKFQNNPLFWKLMDRASVLGKISPLARPTFNPKKLNVSLLPVNEEIGLPENTVLPVQIMKDFIERASHRVIVDVCNCREALSCKRYPIDIGCLFLGRAALEIHPTVGHEVSVKEALEFADRAIDEGLIPCIGKAWIDNVYFGIKNRAQLMTMCFCCECCCILRMTRHTPVTVRSRSLRKLEGLRLEVTDSCDGCGKCTKRCFVDAATIEDERAVIGPGCLGCGRCATVCPNDAISLSLESPSFVEEVRDRIESIVDIN